MKRTNYAKFRFRGFNERTLKSIAKAAQKKLKEFEFSRFLLGCTFQKRLSEEAKRLLKKEVQPLIVKKLEKALDAKADFDNPQVELLADFNQDLLFYQIKPVFISGRYKKFSRKITQTVHYCYKCKGKGCDFCNQTGILTKESVQSLVEKHAIPAFKADSAKFHGSGREDKNVKMLGSGRKFVLELVEPKNRKTNLKKLQEKINKKEGKKIEVMNLDYSSKEEVVKIKKAKNDKVYRAIIECEKKIDKKKLNSLKGKSFTVKQRTPNRVKKRRSDRVRERRVELNSLKAKSKKRLSLELKTEAGLYVKEFVSGDSGRTKPSLSSLLENECECKQLDVLKIVPKSLSSQQK